METRPRRARVRELSPLPSTIDAFMRLVETGWDAEATRRPTASTPPWCCTST
ncbi:HNH endonuclease domain protein [Mycobacterium xenopi 3993]|nr:HNH endonuclease domain protein [Mycobacterium xenopi 3993]